MPLATRLKRFYASICSRNFAPMQAKMVHSKITATDGNNNKAIMARSSLCIVIALNYLCERL